MGKETGLGANFYYAGVDLSGDSQAFGTISKGLTPALLTGIDKSAIERKAGQLDGKIAWTSYFNPTNAHAILEDLPRTSQIGSYWHRPLVGAAVASCTAKQTNYDPKRDNKGGLTCDIELLADSYWLDWGLGLTNGKRSDTAATNGTGVDFTAAANFGINAYLHGFSFTGTSVTVKLQGSSDNGVGDAWSDITGGTFTVISGFPVTERLATARNLAVERYMRVITTGTFSEFTFAVVATVNRTDMTI